MIYIKLFWEFFKTGLLSVGGGMANLPFLIKISEKTAWFTTEELTDMIAVSESTPGPIGINMSTYVGWSVSGLIGSLCTTIGLITPSIIIIILISLILEKFKDNLFVKKVFVYLRASVVSLISLAFVNVFKIAIFPNEAISYVRIVTYLLLVALAFKFTKIHPLYWILLGALLGLFFL